MVYKSKFFLQINNFATAFNNSIVALKIHFMICDILAVLKWSIHITITKDYNKKSNEIKNANRKRTIVT